MEVTMRCYWLILFLLVSTALIAQAQTSRAATAASYLERGNEWMTKGELDRAIADYSLAIAFDSQSAIAYYNRSCARQLKGDLMEAPTIATGPSS